MATVNIFASFEYDKDNELVNNFFTQAKQHSHHKALNRSLKEAYPTQQWKDKAEVAIRECHVVVVLIGQDTHSAPGVKTEIEIARRLGIPIFQIQPQKRTYTGVPVVKNTIRWYWKRINRELDKLAN